MRSSLHTRYAALLLFAVSAISTAAQAPPAHSSELTANPKPNATETPGSQLPGEILREIDDQQTGARWLLTRDRMHPGGPGKLVLLQGRIADAGPSGNANAHAALTAPVIHAGEAVIVEEHTAVVDARLGAVALGVAVGGGELKARLKIGGKVVRVMAIAAGRAELQAESGAQP
jgi:hypothetical protein